MPRSSTTGLPFLVRRTDTGKFCYHRDVPAAVAAFVTGEVVLPWKEGIHQLEGRPTVKVLLATGDEATARVRWNRVHEQVAALAQMGQVLAAEKEQRGRERRAMQRLPAGAVGTITAQARHDLLAEISKAVSPNAHAALVADGASWHVSDKLVIPGNITLVKLPPYAPELNPIENVWANLRGTKLAHRLFDSYKDIVDACCDAWNSFIADPATVRSITTRQWATCQKQCPGPLGTWGTQNGRDLPRP